MQALHLNHASIAARDFLALFSLACCISLRAQAPASIAGRTFEVTITSGTPPVFASQGSYRFLPSGIDQSYVVVRISGDTANSFGAYTYSKTGAASATLSFTDSSVGVGFSAAVTFTSANSGSLFISSPLLLGVSQRGTFVMYAGNAPASIAGGLFDVVITSGTFPFADRGSFRLEASASGPDYTISGFSGVSNGRGTYTYSRTSPSTAIVILNDSVTGIGQAQLSFSSDLAGTYFVLSVGAGAYQTGLFTLVKSMPLAITVQPLSRVVNAGSAVTFSIGATGTALVYQWRKDGSNLANGGRLSGATSANLTINNVLAGDAGSYSVVVSNAAGSVTSAAATLTVVVPPSIVIQPQSQTVTAGAFASFAVSANGTPPLSFQWQRNGVAIPGALSATLVLNGVTASQAGSYSVVVSNVAGSVTSLPALLTVNSPASLPVITVQPQSTNVMLGSVTTFTVAVTGTPPLTFQWKKNSANISGATSASLTLTYQWHKNGTDLAGQTGPSLTLPSVRLSARGTYTVVIRNAYGETLSDPAVLVVESGQ